MRGPSTFLHSWPEDFETVMRALDERAQAGKRTIVTADESVAKTFIRYNRPVPVFFASALVADFSMESLDR